MVRPLCEPDLKQWSIPETVFDSNSGIIRLPNEVIIPGNTPTALNDFVTEASRIQKTN